jgi:hypothetical protein
MATDPQAELILYRRADCSLCDETKAVLDALLEERGRAGLPAPAVRELDITTDPGLERDFGHAIPVVALGDRRLDLVTSASRLRRFLSDALDPSHVGR